MRNDDFYKIGNMQDNISRDIDIDIMRIAAAFFVVVIHTSGYNSFPAVFYNSVSRFSVPVFILISGNYILHKHISGKRLTHKCAQLFLVMTAWSAVYYVYGWISGEITHKSMAALIKYLLTEPIHLWFLYALIGLYIFSPVLRTFCVHASKAEYIYILTVTFLLGSIVTLALRTESSLVLSLIMNKMQINTQLGFVFLYLMASFIQKFEIRIRMPYLCLLFAAAALLSFLGTLFIKCLTGIPDDLLLSFFAPNTLIGGIAFYLIIKEWYGARPSKHPAASRCIIKAASSTFGVYLMHPLVIKILDAAFFSKTNLPLDSFALIPARAAAAFSVSLAIALITKRFLSELILWK